jgi:hypothetical protein
VPDASRSPGTCDHIALPSGMGKVTKSHRTWKSHPGALALIFNR